MTNLLLDVELWPQLMSTISLFCGNGMKNEDILASNMTTLER